MVSITTYGGASLDNKYYGFNYVLDYANKTKTSTVYKSIGLVGDGAELRGTGFKYAGADIPTAGVITTISEYDNGKKVWTITGASASMKDLVIAQTTEGKSVTEKSFWEGIFSKADTLTGGSGSDKIYGYAGNDQLNGSTGDDKIYGGTGSDKLFGGAGVDHLYGDSGDDFLNSGFGADNMFGGTGADTFVFRSFNDSSTRFGVDYIADFSSVDRIDLRDIDASIHKAGNQTFTFIGSKDFTAEGQLRVVKDGSDFHVYGDVNGDKTADFEITVHSATLLKDYFLL